MSTTVQPLGFEDRRLLCRSNMEKSVRKLSRGISATGHALLTRRCTCSRSTRSQTSNAHIAISPSGKRSGKWCCVSDAPAARESREVARAWRCLPIGRLQELGAERSAAGIRPDLARQTAVVRPDLVLSRVAVLERDEVASGSHRLKPSAARSACKRSAVTKCNPCIPTWRAAAMFVSLSSMNTHASARKPKRCRNS